MPYLNKTKKSNLDRALLPFVFALTITTLCSFTSNKFENAEQYIERLLNNSLNIELTLDSLAQVDDNLLKGIANYRLLRKEFQKKKYSNAREYAKVAIEALNQTDYNKKLGYCYYFIGNIGIEEKEQNQVINSYHRSINYFEKCSFWDGIISCHYKLATYYSLNKIYTLAREHFGKAKQLFIYSSNDRLKSISLLNFASYYNEVSETDSALLIYKDIEHNYIHKLSKGKLSRLYNNIAIIYSKEKNYFKAKEYYNKSLSLKDQLNDSIGIINTTQNIFNLSLLLNDIESAKFHYNTLRKVFNNKDTSKVYIDFLYNEINYQILIGNTNTIPKLVDSYMRSYQQFYNKDFSDKLIEMQKSFEIKERDKNIALLEKEDELKEARLSNQLIVIISIGSVLLLLIVLGYFINKQRVKLKRSESHLKKQQKRIKQINSDLKTSNLAKDRILSIIGHDLRGPIGGLKELIELYMDMPGYEEEDFKSLLKAAREASTGSYYLLENLLTWANSQNGQIDFKPLTAPLLPLAKTSIDLLDSSINTRNVSFKYDISPAIKLTADLNMLRTIIRNLVSNAVKYSPPESCITISATQNNEETFICIADQGYGMTAEQSSALFEKKETYFIEAGYNAKGSGLGLVLCREFVEQHKGKIWADSVPNKGTKVCFTIPLNIEHPKTTSALHKHTPAMN